MKRFVASVAALFAAFALMTAQSVEEATKVAKQANDALVANDYTTALPLFQQALGIAEACGEKGQQIVDICKGIIPKTMSAIANQKLLNKDYDGALQQLRETLSVAKQYGADAVKAKVEKLIPQILIAKGSGFLNEKDWDSAAEAYGEALEADPANGVAALRLGQALEGAGKAAEAVEAFKTAADNGQQKNAFALLGRHFMTLATKAFKEKNYSDALKYAVESDSYVPSAYTKLLAGQASQLQGKNTEALMHYLDYLETAPDADNAKEVAYTVAALYQQAGDKAKADEYFAKAK